ncbi:hypothetical protein MCHIJ_16590 [Mycolicibacterium chitae]|uniref:DUF4331 domain-containing protein n=1 Tax=Mycolicibacterium chitae TaxID=1792 RepID=A0A3S5EHV3_MYCCI|nr:DUF4331 family protein [Mycolicibacterium chitae]MCV7106403.1 DUF4331 family protein [Mycolicibacterium chitae]BBZ02222.1 hypothetical protein MCHIJ_16590 [Mycolicibacterium chitae]VEG44380.1 Uncharacterised protein [Mycolicibacterium chitae]
MADQYIGLSVNPPRGDQRLDLRDLYVFPSPSDPANTVLILTANTNGESLHPDAIYRINVDNDGDLRTDIAFSFVFAEPKDGVQTFDLYLAVDRDAEEPQAVGSRLFSGVELCRGPEAKVLRSGSFTVFCGIRSDPLFCDVEGVKNLLGIAGTQGNPERPWTGVDSNATTNVIAMAVEMPTSAIGAEPDIRVWGRCTIREDGEWKHIDRVGHPAIRGFLTDDETRAAYYATNPIQDRARWIGLFIARMGETGGYNRAEAIAAIDREGTLPDMLTYRPSRPAKYPNGRTFTDDVIDYRLNFLTKGESQAPGLTPHTDTLDEFPYLGPPH